MKERESQNVREWRHFLKGIVVGVLGNVIVSATFGTIESQGLNKIAYTITLGLSVLFLDYIIKKEGEELGISKTWIRKVRWGFGGYLVLWFDLH